MGHKSKFTFPMPSRKPKEPPTISPPLTKVQKILGTGHINIDSLSVPNSNPRQWDVRSTGGISISVSESTTSLATDGKGYSNIENRENGDSAGRKHGHRIWDQESAVLPRFLRTAHSSNDELLNGKKSAGARSADYLDVTTDASSIRRQHSSSTIHSHYEKASVPLSVSQQTSNSAIARGLPPKAKALLDVEGVHINRLDSRKKKPPRLDLLMFTGRHRRQQQHQRQQQHPQQQQQQEVLSPEVEPVLGNNYVMKSPSLVSPRLEEPHQSPEMASRLLPTDQAAPPFSSTRPNRLRASSDTTHQLSDHYEQMLFINEPSPDLEPRSESPIESTICGGSSPIGSPPFFDPLPAPSRQIIRKRSENWSPTRRPSKESELSMFSGQAPSFQSIDPVAAKDSASSISSRYTRTSKASRTDKSILESDRQITSVLSLSDTDSDEEVVQSATRSSPFSQKSIPEDPRTAAPVRGPSSARQSVTGSIASDGSHAECYAQLNEYLGIPQSTPRSQNSRVRSKSTVRSNHSSTSTVLPFQATSRSSLEPSCFPDRSTRTSDGSSLLTQLRDSEYTVREAKAISLRPLVSTGGTPSWVPSIETTATPPRQPGTRTSLKSRSPEQPTPPMSPLSLESIEIYLQSPEPPQPPHREETMADDSSSSKELNNSRFMAVTKQEEMLLAALRNKRAMMRENGFELGEEDDELEDGVGYGEMSCIAQSGKGTSTMTPPAQNQGAKLQVPITGSGGRQPPKTVPKRRSSLVDGKLGRGTFSAICGDQYTQEQLKTLRYASAVDARPKTAGERSTSSSQSRSQASGSTGSRSRARVPRDRAFMYLEHPPMPQGLHESANASDPVLGSRHIADIIEETGNEEHHESEHQPRRATDEDRSPPRTASSTSDTRSRRERGREPESTEKRDEYKRRHHHDRHHHDQHQQQGREKVQEPERHHARADSDTKNDDLMLAAPRSRKQQLQRLSEDGRETDDDPDGDSDGYERDEDEESEIDFDAFPAPATHSGLFGSAIGGLNGSANSSIIGLGISGIGGSGAQAQEEDWMPPWAEKEQKNKGKGKEVERLKETADTFRPWSPFTQQQEQLQHMQRSETPTTPVSGGGHIRGKKSGVRLSAVGRKDSLLPWLGDDD
ncbi:hypothetical protein SLS62_004874 [Diatrype stigma]|uniref:Uncharacterized protein n=1 Tax=Diatrype stigma TaxID=117547 RepID=A0AAN9UTX5_9PEZI